MPYLSRDESDCTTKIMDRVSVLLSTCFGASTGMWRGLFEGIHGNGGWSEACNQVK